MSVRFSAPSSSAAQPVKIMAILNVTPDSFSDGGRLSGLDAILKAAETSIAAGAELLDIGGESTRPGALTITAADEIERVRPAIEAIHKRFPKITLSIDTRKAAVAESALEVGARIVNDVSGLCYDPAIAAVVARYQAGLIIMHSQGEPQTMQHNPQYPNGVVESVSTFFEQQVNQAVQAGVAKERIILDPGFGFGKTRTHNLTLLAQLNRFQRLGYPILVGLSRKTFLSPVAESGKALLPPAEREALTAAGIAMAVERGARYIRIHDVARHASVIRLTEALLKTAMVALIGIFTVCSAASWADSCSDASKQALSLLKSTQQQALDNQHPDPERFNAEFAKAVAPLKIPLCADEMKKLNLYIEKERKKYPPAMPIED